MRRNTPRLLHCLAVISFAGAAGCRKAPEPAAAPPPPPPKPTVVSDVDLKSYKPNEAGAVMIVMFHRFNKGEPNNDLNRQPDTFRKDLQTLYDRKYHPVNLLDFVSGKMDVPGGKTPIVLTFDDALPSQFRTVIGSDGQPHIDPDCAVGIMETFAKEHEDWPTRATFFVLPNVGSRGTDPFGQPESVGDKFDYLVKRGYEIANHTSTHSSLKRMSPQKIAWELATAVKSIKQINPGAQMQTLALPYGHVPAGKLMKDVISGEEGGTQYHNVAVMKAAWRPCLPPITRNAKSLTRQANFCVFDPSGLERSVPDARKPKTAGTFEYWLSWFDKHPGERYVSDGQPGIAAVPRGLASLVDADRARDLGLRVQLYSLTGGSSGGGGGLSVQ